MKTRNFAHRGARSLAPENTLAAVAKAWEIGVDGIEVDVQFCGSDHLVILHDKTLKRTTNIAEIFPDRAGAPVNSFTLDEIKTLDAGSWFLDADPFKTVTSQEISFSDMEAIQKCAIPTLDELLTYCAHKEWLINLELKHYPTLRENRSLPRAVIAVIDRLKFDKSRVILSSFNHDYLEEIRSLSPEIEINALIGDRITRSNNWGKYEYAVYNANAAYIDKNQIESANRRGCRVNLYTVNDPEDMRKFISWGVDILITDYPQRLKSIIQEVK